MNPHHPVTPARSIIVWLIAALAGAAGVVLAHGFRGAPPVENAGWLARLLMAACLELFVLSRVLMLFPAAAVRSRLAHWWVDFVLIVAAAVWWIVNRDAEAFILRAGTAYVLLVGAGAIFRSGMNALVEGLPRRSVGSAAMRLAGLILALVVIGGLVLTLPVCRRAQQAVESDHVLAWYQLKVDYLNSTFTAAAALTGTGLTVQDVGYHYSRVGQLVVLVLMLIGGLGVLCVAAIVGMHFRRLLGWTGIDDDTSPAALRGVVLFVCVFALIVQAIGAVGLYRMWDPSVDLNYGTAVEEPSLLGPYISGNPLLPVHYDEARLFASIFHSVSAFTNCGLTLTRDGYLPYRDLPGPLLAIMPLMFLGSLGGPVLLELLRRMTRRSDAGLESTSKDTWVTLGGSVAVLLLGAAALFVFESTRDYQQRYPREKTPGRLMVNGGGQDELPRSGPAGAFGTIHPDPLQPIEFSAATSQRAKAERLASMTVGNRIRAAAFQAETARTGGAKSARIDETSLSPVSHLVLIGLMLTGGGVGGAAGGLRVVVLVILLAAILKGGRPHHPEPRSALEGDPARAVGLAAGIASALFLLVGVVAAVLLYRETGTFLACVFEAVSACCNAGLSLGLTAELSLPGRMVLILGMLLGRAIPLAILMRAIIPSPAVLPRPLLAPAPPPDDDDAPIRLE